MAHRRRLGLLLPAQYHSAATASVPAWPGDDGGACGEVTTHVLAVKGLVEDNDGISVEGASVILEDRGWNPGDVLGSGTTDENGVFQLDNLTVTGVEDCWGTMLDYVLVAEKGEARAEKEINTQLYNAVIDDSGMADVSAFPIVLGAGD